MRGQILVPLKKRDRIGEIIRCLDLIAQPGMTVTFIVAYHENVSWPNVELTAIHTGLRTAGNLQRLAANSSREAQLRWHEKRIAEARGALRKRGLSVRVHFYNGSFARAVASLREIDTEMIVLLSEHYRIIQNCVAWVRGFLHGFKTGRTSILFLRLHRQN